MIDDGSSLGHPGDCKWCTEALTCPTKSFEANQIIEPLNIPGQTIQEYLQGLCECGNQLVVHFEDKPPELPEFIPHTKMCREHTLHWMTKVAEMKVNYDKQWS